MYTEHKSFHFPATPSAKIWRYMDFTKFVSLLETRCLYFARIDRLGDLHEFTMPLSARTRWAPIMDKLRPLHQSHGQVMYVNCWHRNEYESAAMWRLYLKSNEGIAVQSTAKRFADSFRAYSDDVHIGRVKYIDYEKADIGGYNLFEYALLKRISYKHENEIRAITNPCVTIPGRRVVDRNPGPEGMSIPVVLEELVKSVYVAPTAEEWLVTLVRQVVDRYGLTVPVIQSDLAKPPR